MSVLIPTMIGKHHLKLDTLGEFSNKVLQKCLTTTITRIDNEIEKIPDRFLHCQERLETLKEQLETAKLEVQKPFAQEEELQQKTARLGELKAMLDMDKKEHPILDVEPDESVEVVETKCKVLER